LEEGDGMGGVLFVAISLEAKGGGLGLQPVWVHLLPKMG